MWARRLVTSITRVWPHTSRDTIQRVNRTMCSSSNWKIGGFKEEMESKKILSSEEEKFGERDEDLFDEGGGFYLYQNKDTIANRASTFNLERGKRGVYDIDQLVDCLRAEKGKDITVMKVPVEFNYTEHLVLVTIRTKRHMNALLTLLRKLYKLKKGPNDNHLHHPVGQGKDNSDWIVLDMGNIVLHLFQPKVREKYDIESLWTLGPEFDETLVNPKQDPILDMMEKHVQFLDSLQPEVDIIGLK